MKKKIMILILVFSIIALAVILKTVIFDSNKNINGEVNIVLGSEPNSLDPAISLTIDVRSYLSNLFEGLVNLDKNGNVLANFPINNGIINDLKEDLQLNKSIKFFCCSKLESQMEVK